ncbi:NACHT domain protein [Streptomyces sp. AVP053U2]|nr:NACHT domain protein [Streptomyces sp. AVP053U2]
MCVGGVGPCTGGCEERQGFSAKGGRSWNGTRRRRSGRGDGDTHNEFSGVGGPVVLGRDFLGPVTVNPPVDPPSRTTGEADLVRAADDLASAVTRQWREEAALRRLNDPYPLPVRWRSADPELMEPWRSLLRLATTGIGWAPASPSGWASGPEALSGGGGELVGVLTRVPTGRLVVLGEPGSGKTVLLVRLVLDLLVRRRPGGPVPVLVPLASWDPDREELDLWLEQRLGIDYPWLGDPGRTGASRGRELLDAGCIMLVLDGLDEIPDGVRRRAIARINDTLGLHPDLGMVLSSRSAPFAATVRPRSGPEVRVIGAAGVEVEPLDLDTVASYLRDSAGGPTNEARRQKVFAALAAGHDPHPLAQLLTTPLMAYLARVAYDPPPDAGEDIGYASGPEGRPSDPAQDSAYVPAQDCERDPAPDGHHAPAGHPAELLDRSPFPTPAAIRAHLLDSFIPASYARHRTPPPPPARTAGPSRPKPHWTLGQASHFLTCLARDLEDRQQGTTDLRWWDLPDAAPRVLAGAVVGLVAVPAGVVMPFGAWLGAGMIVGVAVALLGRRWSPPNRTFNRGLAGGLIGSLLGSAFGLGMRATLGIESPAGYLVSGLALGLVPGFLGGFRAGLAGGLAASFVGAFVGEPEMGDSAPWVNSVGFAVAAACVVTLGHSRLPARGLRWSPIGILTGLGGGLALGSPSPCRPACSTGCCRAWWVPLAVPSAQGWRPNRPRRRPRRTRRPHWPRTAPRSGPPPWRAASRSASPPPSSSDRSWGRGGEPWPEWPTGWPPAWPGASSRPGTDRSRSPDGVSPYAARCHGG